MAISANSQYITKCIFIAVTALSLSVFLKSNIISMIYLFPDTKMELNQLSVIDNEKYEKEVKTDK